MLTKRPVAVTKPAMTEWLTNWMTEPRRRMDMRKKMAKT